MTPAIRVLGPVEVVSPAGPLTLSREERAVLAALVVARPEALPGMPGRPDDATLGALALPAVAAGDRTERLARLVRRLVADLRAAGVDVAARHDGAGWTLRAAPGVVDADVVAVALARARAALAAGSGEDALVLLESARDQLDDEPLGDVPDPWFDAPRDVLRVLRDATTALAAQARRRAVDERAAPPATAPVLAWTGDPLRHKPIGRDRPVPRDPAPPRDDPAWGTPPPGPDADAALGRLTPTALPDGSWSVIPGAGAPAGGRPAGPGPAGTATRARPTGAASVLPGAGPSAAPTAPVPLGWALFGPALVREGTAPLEIHDRVTHALLAALLLRRGRPVPLADLVRAGWPDEAPPEPEAGVEVHLERAAAHLRGLTGHRLPVTSTPTLSGPAWTIEPDPGSVDVDRADRHAAAARSSADPAARADLLRSAVAEVVGRPLDGLTGPGFEPERHALDAWREALLLEAVAADVATGRDARALPDLRALVRRLPLREDLWELLLLAAARCEGRDAGLAVYADAVHRLERLLGAAPGPSLQAARRRVEAGGA